MTNELVLAPSSPDRPLNPVKPGPPSEAQIRHNLTQLHDATRQPHGLSYQSLTLQVLSRSPQRTDAFLHTLAYSQAHSPTHVTWPPDTIEHTSETVGLNGKQYKPGEVEHLQTAGGDTGRDITQLIDAGYQMLDFMRGRAEAPPHLPIDTVIAIATNNELAGETFKVMGLSKKQQQAARELAQHLFYDHSDQHDQTTLQQQLDSILSKRLARHKKMKNLINSLEQ